jgi:hypothetical protein
MNILPTATAPGNSGSTGGGSNVTPSMSNTSNNKTMDSSASDNKTSNSDVKGASTVSNSTKTTQPNSSVSLPSHNSPVKKVNLDAIKLQSKSSYFVLMIVLVGAIIAVAGYFSRKKLKHLIKALKPSVK